MDYLDGLRGLAALYVVLYHASDITWAMGALPRPLVMASKLMVYGRFAVSIFITLSGYCLMLPVAGSLDGKLNGGFKRYLSRRARRILPPYYAACLLSLLLIWLFPRDPV